MADRNDSKHGAKTNGQPGERTEYMKGYYAAYVLDPLGNNIEVVHFDVWWMKMMGPAAYVGVAALGGAIARLSAVYVK